MYRAILAMLQTLTQQLTALADIKRQLKALNDAVTANHADSMAKLQAVQHQVNTNSNQLASIAASLTNIGVEVESVDSVLEQIAVKVAPLVNDISTIESGVTQANASLAQIINALAPLNNNFVEIVFGTPKRNK